MIYLNAAGHGLPDPAVRARMIRHLQREDEIGPIQAETEAADEMTSVRAKAARLIDAHQDEIALPPWTTSGWNAAVLSLPLGGRRVLVAPGEWASNIALLQRRGARIETMPLDQAGRVSVEKLAQVIDDDLTAICAPLVCSLTGEHYPLDQIGQLARPESCAFVVDAAQALGQVPVSVQDLNADILAAPVRKWLRGPRGTGILYVRRRWLDRMTPSLVADYGGATWDGLTFQDRPDARRFEAMGSFAPQRLGMGVALDLYLADPHGIQTAITARADHVRTAAANAGIALAGSESLGSGIVTLRLAPDSLGPAMKHLTEAEIVVKAPQRDCEPMRDPATHDGGFLRISPHVYNTPDQIDRVFGILAAA
ncbi:MAG: aminotransferase class V-fold PLP-dependent enzyme [Pseudomonadota bacterium]